MTSLREPIEAGEEPGLAEFVAMMALTMSLVALSIDAMLPAFPDIGRDLQVVHINDVQLVISVLLIGLAFGQLIYGPLSDAMGRKTALYAGFAVFIVGCIVSIYSQNFFYMLLGRLLQGIGAAGPRTVSTALIRDRFSGSAMARVMSLIMTVFILVPILAPALGQFLMLLAGWRAIFGALLTLAVTSMVWLAIRQPETLPPEKRLPFTFTKMLAAFRIVLGSRVSMVYTAILGCVSGALFGYINVSQQILAEQYRLGQKFPLFFGLIAMSVGAASILNGTMVMRLGMRRLADGALAMMMALSWLFFGLSWFNDGHPPLYLFMVCCLALFFCIGVLFGNLNSIAMEPLGRVAGTGAAVIGSLSTVLAVILGFLFGHAYNGTVIPMATGFALLSTSAVLLARSVRLKPETGH